MYIVVIAFGPAFLKDNIFDNLPHAILVALFKIQVIAIHHPVTIGICN